jgi:hypothetical protein
MSTPVPCTAQVLLVLSADGKGIVMRPGGLRPATRRAAEGKRRGRGAAAAVGDVRAVLGQGDGDGAAETPAGAGDQCRRSGKFLRWHAGLP